MSLLRSIGLLCLMAVLLAAVGVAGLLGRGGMSAEHIIVVLTESCPCSTGPREMPKTRMNAGRDTRATLKSRYGIQQGNRYGICMGCRGLAQPACEAIHMIEDVPAQDGFDTNCKDA